MTSRDEYEAQRDELEAEMARVQEELDHVNRNLESSPDEIPERDAAATVDEDIKLVTLTAYADGHYQVEAFCPAEQALNILALSLRDLLTNVDALSTETKKQGYGE